MSAGAVQPRQLWDIYPTSTTTSSPTPVCDSEAAHALSSLPPSALLILLIHVAELYALHTALWWCAHVSR